MFKPLRQVERRRVKGMLIEVCLQYYEPTLPKPLQNLETPNASNSLDYLADEIVTAYENNIKLHYPQQLESYFSKFDPAWNKEEFSGGLHRTCSVSDLPFNFTLVFLEDD